MEPVILSYRPGESMVLTRYDDRIVLTAGSIRLDLSTDNPVGVEWYARRGEELERTLRDRLSMLDEGRRISSEGDQFANALAAREVSSAFEGVGLERPAKVYRSVSELFVDYALRMSEDRTVN